jgi:hypothetical protein
MAKCHFPLSYSFAALSLIFNAKRADNLAYEIFQELENAVKFFFTPRILEEQTGPAQKNAQFGPQVSTLVKR